MPSNDFISIEDPKPVFHPSLRSVNLRTDTPECRHRSFVAGYFVRVIDHNRSPHLWLKIAYFAQIIDCSFDFNG